MKKLILIFALIVSFASFGQDADFSYYDIKDISSLKLFKKFCFEEGFKKVKENDIRNLYAFNYDPEEGATVWVAYNDSNLFQFQFTAYVNGKSYDVFESLVNQVKKNCQFYDVYDESGDDYICYSCPDATYKGKIGFRRGEGTDYIRTFDF